MGIFGTGPPSFQRYSCLVTRLFSSVGWRMRPGSSLTLRDRRCSSQLSTILKLMYFTVAEALVICMRSLGVYSIPQPVSHVKICTKLAVPDSVGPSGFGTSPVATRHTTQSDDPTPHLLKIAAKFQYVRRTTCAKHETETDSLRVKVQASPSLVDSLVGS